MVTYLDLYEMKQELKKLEKEAIVSRDLMLIAKRDFDKEANSGEVSSETANILLMAMKSYEQELKYMELADAYAKSAIALYEFKKKMKEDKNGT